MNPLADSPVSVRPLAWALSLSLMLAAAASPPVRAQAATGGQAPTGAAAAGERCEAAVADTVRQMRGTDAREVSFTRSRRAIAPTSGDEADVKGEGLYRGDAAGARSFSYSCAYNARTGATSGVVFRDLGAARADTATSDKPWQPDLSTLSPEACESQVVVVLKAKYPRVGRIAFGSDSRKLRAGADGRTLLEGQGGVERAVGMNLVPFDYRCEYDTRSGKVVGARTNL